MQISDRGENLQPASTQNMVPLGATEAEDQRLQQLDVWIGWCRLLGVAALVLLYSGISWAADSMDWAWVYVALVALPYSALWLVGTARTSGLARRRFIWFGMLGDTGLMYAVAVVSPVPPGTWLPIWCLLAVYNAIALGRTAGYATCVLALVSMAFIYGSLPWVLEDPLSLMAAAVVVVCVLILATLMGQMVEEDRQLRARLRILAIRDGLTGLYNHRFFHEEVQRELSRSKREEQPLSLLMVDIDNFKVLNDAHGHPSGDEVLRIVASLLLDGVRDYDKVFRYGGEEFTAVLPHTSSDSARNIARRIHAAIREYPFRYGRVTVSVGWSTFPSPAVDKDELIRQADKAMYTAKHKGRDRVHEFQCA